MQLPELPEGWEIEETRGHIERATPYYWVRKSGYKTFCIDHDKITGWRVEANQQWNYAYNGMYGYATKEEAFAALNTLLTVLEHEFKEPTK